MSRSRKKHPILKDKTGHKWYNRIIRSRQKQDVRNIISLQDVMDYEIKSPKVIIQDYDVCDWKMDFGRLRSLYGRFFSKEDVEKALRK